MHKSLRRACHRNLSFITSPGSAPRPDHRAWPGIRNAPPARPTTPALVLVSARLPAILGLTSTTQVQISTTYRPGRTQHPSKMSAPRLLTTPNTLPANATPTSETQRSRPAGSTGRFRQQPTISTSTQATLRQQSAVHRLRSQPRHARRPVTELNLASSTTASTTHRHSHVVVLARRRSPTRITTSPRTAIFIKGTATPSSAFQRSNATPNSTLRHNPRQTPRRLRQTDAQPAKCSSKQLGAAQLIAKQAPTALRPDNSAFCSHCARDHAHPARLLTGNLDTLFLLLAGSPSSSALSHRQHHPRLSAGTHERDRPAPRPRARPRHIAANSSPIHVSAPRGLIGTAIGISVRSRRLANHWTQYSTPTPASPHTHRNN